MKKILLFLLIYLSSLSFLFSDNSEKEFIESSSCFLVQKNRYNNFTLNFCSNFYSNNVVFFIYDDIQDDVIYKKIFYASKELLNDVFYCSGYYNKKTPESQCHNKIKVTFDKNDMHPKS